MIQLLIKNNNKWVNVDIYEEESIQLEFKLDDMVEVEKTFATYSQDFVVPSTTNNDEVFNFYYDLLIDEFKPQSFDALITLNGVAYKYGRLILQSAKVELERIVAYSVSFNSGLIPLKEKLGDATLGDIDWTDLQFEWNITNVGEKILTSFQDDIMVPLISTSRIWNAGDGDSNDITTSAGAIRINELRPAIKMKTILDRVIDHFDLDINFQLYEEPFFDKLYCWLNMNASESISYPLLLTNAFVTNYNFSDPEISQDDYTQVSVLPNGHLLISESTTPMNQNVITVRVNGLVNTSTASNQNIDVKIVFNEYNIGTDTVKNKFEVVGQRKNNGAYYEFNLDFQNQGRTREFKLELSSEEPIAFNSFHVIYAPYTVRWVGSTSSNPSGWNRSSMSAMSLNNQNVSSRNFSIGYSLSNVKVLEFLEGLCRLFNIKVFETSSSMYSMDFKTKLNEEIINITPFASIDETSIESTVKYKSIKLMHSEEDYLRNEAFRNTTGYEYGSEIYDTESAEYTEEYEVETKFNILSYFTLNGTNLITSYGFDSSLKPVNPSTLTIMFINPSTWLYTNEGTVGEEIRIWDDVQNSAVQFYSYRPFSNVDSLNKLTHTNTLTFNNEVMPYDTDFATRNLYSNYYKEHFDSIYKRNTFIYNYKCYFDNSIKDVIDMEKIYEIGGYIYKPVELSFDIVSGIADLKLRNYQPQIVPNITITPPIMFNVFNIFYNRIEVAFNGSTISHGEIVGHEIQWAVWNNVQNWANSTTVTVPTQQNNQISYVYSVNGLAPDERYRIRIRSIGDAGHVSMWKEIIQETNEMPIITLPKFPTVPATFTATKSNANSTLTFTVGGATTPAPTTITLYEVQYRSTSSNQGNWYTHTFNYNNTTNYTATVHASYGFWELRARTKNSDGNYSPWKELGTWLHIFDPDNNGGGNNGGVIGGAPGSNGGGVITQPGLNLNP